jgi:hypothetical protein
MLRIVSRTISKSQYIGSSISIPIYRISRGARNDRSFANSKAGEEHAITNGTGREGDKYFLSLSPSPLPRPSPATSSTTGVDISAVGERSSMWRQKRTVMQIAGSGRLPLPRCTSHGAHLSNAPSVHLAVSHSVPPAAAASARPSAVSRPSAAHWLPLRSPFREFLTD